MSTYSGQRSTRSNAKPRRAWDGMMWADYEADLEPRLEDLHGRVHRGAYRPRPSRRTYIPKADRKRRPLAIAVAASPRCFSSRGSATRSCRRYCGHRAHRLPAAGAQLGHGEMRRVVIAAAIPGAVSATPVSAQCRLIDRREIIEWRSTRPALAARPPPARAPTSCVWGNADTP
jgi:hypothetical protein